MRATVSAEPVLYRSNVTVLNYLKDSLDGLNGRPHKKKRETTGRPIQNFKARAPRKHINLINNQDEPANQFALAFQQEVPSICAQPTPTPYSSVLIGRRLTAGG